MQEAAAAGRKGGHEKRAALLNISADAARLCKQEGFLLFLVEAGRHQRRVDKIMAIEKENKGL